MSDPRIEAWIQYTHLDKLYGYLPGMTQALPAVFGLDPESYAERTARFAAHARQAAGQLLADSSLAGRVDAVPFHPGQLVLAVGDSVTDDLQSWAEILRHLLDLRRPGDGVRVVNSGLSAHTTAMVLRRWPATLATTPWPRQPARRPDQPTTVDKEIDMRDLTGKTALVTGARGASVGPSPNGWAPTAP